MDGSVKVIQLTEDEHKLLKVMAQLERESFDNCPDPYLDEDQDFEVVERDFNSLCKKIREA